MSQQIFAVLAKIVIGRFEMTVLGVRKNDGFLQPCFPPTTYSILSHTILDVDYCFHLHYLTFRIICLKRMRYLSIYLVLSPPFRYVGIEITSTILNPITRVGFD